jgi:F-type H+-transporting ATPase subunit delta
MTSSRLSAEVVEPYADALMSLARAHNLTERFGQDLRSLLELLEGSQELQAFLANPLIAAGDKQAVLQRIAGDSTHSYLQNFLRLLADKKRLMFAAGIARRYLALLRELNQTALAQVTAAAELSESQRQQVTERVKAMTGARDVELELSYDPELIGGVIVQVGSQVLDASLRGQLRRMSLQMSGAVG